MFKKKNILTIVIMTVFVIVVALVVFALFAPESLFEPSKDSVFKIVKNNQSILGTVPDEIKNLKDNCAWITLSVSATKNVQNSLHVITIKNGEQFDYNMQNDILYKTLKIDGVKGIEQGESDKRFSVFFDCGTGNMAFICGFYYSEDNWPFVEGSDDADELIPDGIGWKIDLSDGGSDYYYTEKIIDNWFYYYENTQDW